MAHDGSHPFENCTEAYDNGYRDIPKGDEHYGKHLDRDNDGVGCDQPPDDRRPQAPREPLIHTRGGPATRPPSP